MRILLVEDEPDIASGLLRALRKEGFSVDLALDGDEGLYKAEATDYDLIILDVMLPKIDGWQILERLRQKQHTPVLILTARDAAKDRVRGLDSGADDYLTKPFDLTELISRVRALIRRSKRQSNPILEVGAVRIDTIACRVTLEGRPVDVTARELMLLEYLCLHRGQTLSRTHLYEHLFDENDDTLSNVIDVQVFNLRKKLGRDLILTRRGLGYCIE